MNIAVVSPRFCRYARAHRSSLLREGARFGQVHKPIHREGRGHVVPKALELPGSSSVFPFLLSHPLATLTTSVVAAIVVPRVVKVVWRALVIPAVVILVGAAVLDSPQTSWDIVSASLGAVVHFIQSNPEVVSLTILAWLVLLLSTRLMPLLLLVVGFLWFTNPSKITQQIPSVGDIAASLIPNPFASVLKPEKAAPSTKGDAPWTFIQPSKAPVIEQQSQEPQAKSGKLWGFF